MSRKPITTTARSSHRAVNLPGQRPGPFSDAVLAGSTLYLSGRLGFDRETGELPADLRTEVANLLEGVRDVLHAAGMDLDDLVLVQIFSPDPSYYQTFNEVYRTYFTDYLPARAFLGSGPLLRGAHFEVCAVAVRR